MAAAEALAMAVLRAVRAGENGRRNSRAGWLNVLNQRRHDVGDPEGRPARHLRHEPEHPAGPRAHRPPLPREESRTALPVRARSRVRPRESLERIVAGKEIRNRGVSSGAPGPRAGRRRDRGGTPAGGRGLPRWSPQGRRANRRGRIPPAHVQTSTGVHRPFRARRADSRLQLRAFRKSSGSPSTWRRIYRRPDGPRAEGDSSPVGLLARRARRPERGSNTSGTGSSSEPSRGCPSREAPRERSRKGSARRTGRRMDQISL